MDFNTNAFHDYDVRGVYPTEVTEEMYERIGKALAVYIGNGPIGVGQDMRTSSPSLAKALISGITSQGVDVVDLGMISSEIHYFASGKYNFAANAIVSASHNPPQYNGLKIVRRGVIALNGEDGLPQIRDLAKRNEFPVSSKIGTVTKMDLMDDWIAHTLSFIHAEKLRPLTIVADAGNGMAGPSWQKLIGKLPVHIVPLYFEPDGTFPHHVPNPLEEKNLEDLKEAIKTNNADVGFAFDGDADRLFILDETGRTLSGTITTAILAKHLLSTKPGSMILYNAICGRIVPETVKSLGGKSLRVRVGHSFIKQYMRENNGLFAGEHSGHYYFKEDFNAESSLITALIFLEFLSASGKKVSEIVKEFDTYPQSGEINFKVSNIADVVKTIREEHTDATSIDDLDGLSVWYPTYWFNIRASKTEPLLRLNVEADSPAILHDALSQLVGRIKSLGGEQK